MTKDVEKSALAVASVLLLSQTCQMLVWSLTGQKLAKSTNSSNTLILLYWMCAVCEWVENISIHHKFLFFYFVNLFQYCLGQLSVQTNVLEISIALFSAVKLFKWLMLMGIGNWFSNLNWRTQHLKTANCCWATRHYKGHYCNQQKSNRNNTTFANDLLITFLCCQWVGREHQNTFQYYLFVSHISVGICCLFLIHTLYLVWHCIAAKSFFCHPMERISFIESH